MDFKERVEGIIQPYLELLPDPWVLSPCVTRQILIELMNQFKSEGKDDVSYQVEFVLTNMSLPSGSGLETLRASPALAELCSRYVSGPGCKSTAAEQLEQLALDALKRGGVREDKYTWFRALDRLRSSGQVI